MECDMSTSDRTINQVRAILSKLDRSIDEARERRTQPPMPTPPPTPAMAPQATPPAPAQPSSPGSAYGRAQPLQRPGTVNQQRWGK
jgi:hypothetical protein